MIGNTMLLGILAVSAYRDWKEKHIYLYVPAGALVMGLILHILCRERALTDMLAGAAIGGVMIIIGRMTGEAVGFGDGLMLVVSGIFLGFWENMCLLMTALLLVGGAALFLVSVGKKGKDYRLPFLPFLLAAYLLQLI